MSKHLSVLFCLKRYKTHIDGDESATEKFTESLGFSFSCVKNELHQHSHGF